MPHGTNGWRPWAPLAGFTVLLHFAWEVPRFLYAGMSVARHDAATWTGLEATAGDVAMALAT